jgi:ribonuclease Z
MKIPITFLGTSQAVPTAKRNHTSVLMEYKDETILIDCGEGTQRQIRIAKINPCKITKILITHWHGDHVLGLPGLLWTLALNNYNKNLHIYGPKGTKYHMEMLYRLFVFTGKIKLDIHEVDAKFFENKDFSISAVPLDHGTPCNGYIFQEKDRLRIKKSALAKLKIPHNEKHKIKELLDGKEITVNNKKINPKNITYFHKGKKIAFAWDTRACKNIELLAKDADLMIIESSYTSANKEQAEQYKHMTAHQVAEIAKKSKTKNMILTHLSQRYSKDESPILHEAKKIFKNTRIAEDFMKVEV